MSKSFTNWVKKNVITRYLMKEGCPEKAKCFEVLQKYLDEEATEEEVRMFHQQIDSCWQCFKEYELDRVLKEMIKQSAEKKEVPSDLAQSIKSKIDNVA